MPAILIVDDDPSCADVLERYLGGLGYDVMIATNGEEALGRLKQEQFELVLLDIAMPGLDGIETLKRILENHPGTKVIMVSGLVDQGQSYKEALALGVVDCISKPYRLQDVGVAIDIAMRT